MIKNLDAYISVNPRATDLEWWVEQRNELQQMLDQGVDAKDALAVRDQLQNLIDILQSRGFHLWY